MQGSAPQRACVALFLDESDLYIRALAATTGILRVLSTALTKPTPQHDPKASADSEAVRLHAPLLYCMIGLVAGPCVTRAPCVAIDCVCSSSVCACRGVRHQAVSRGL